MWGRRKLPKASAREILNHVLALYESHNLTALSTLVNSHAELIRKNYDDFFALGTCLPKGEPLLLRLMQLDEHHNDERMATVHARCLRDLRALELKTALSMVRVLCKHYGPQRLQSYLIDKHLSIVSGYDPEFRPNMNNVLLTAMRRPDEDQSLAVLRVLLQGGIHPDARYKADEGQSALHYAVSHGLWNCARLLLAHGANPDLSFLGTTARQLMAENQADLLANLPSAPPSNTELTSAMFSALWTANEAEFARLLSEAQAREPPAPYAEDDGWCTMLQLASSRGLNDAVRGLLQWGVCADSTCTLRDPPILLAAELGHLDVVLQLARYRLDKTGGRLVGSADVSVTSDHGDTLLHLAARAAHEKSVDPSLLVNLIEVLYMRGELNLHAKNSCGDVPFKLLADLGHPALFQLLIRKGAFLGVDRRAVDDMQTKDLQAAFDSSLSTVKSSRGHKVFDIDFNCFQLSTKQDLSPEMLMLYKISKAPKHMHLLMHPVITSFLDLKWLQLYWIYFINLILYSLFVVTLTIHVLNYDLASSILTALLWLYVVTREIVQAAMAPHDFLLQFENWLHLIIIILTPVSLLQQSIKVGVFLVLAAYAELSLLLGRHPSISRYVAMFLKVYRVNLVLLAVSAPFLFSFAVSFSLLFKNESELFNNPFSAFFKTLVMATGEMDVSEFDFSVSPFISQFVFLLFVVSIETILMNLLHALAVHDTEGIQHSAQLVAVRAKIQLYTRLEAAWLGYPLEWYEGPWDDSDKNRSHLRLRLSKKLKSLVRISVLPLAQDGRRNCASLREDGLLMDGDSRLDLVPGHRYVKPLVQLVTGVSIQDMFDACQEYTALSRNGLEDDVRTLASEIQEMRRELVALRETLSIPVI